MEFDYQDTWEPSTDGRGRSLVIRSPTAAPETWSDPQSWRASLEDDGSPGQPDSNFVLGLRQQGDMNGSGSLEISDAILLVLNLFSQRIVNPCEAEEGNLALQDVDGDGVLTQTDPFRLLTYLFLDGNPPDRGLDCTPLLGCPSACE
jgi:hypothetical protein